MRSHTQNSIPPEKQEQLERLQAQVKHAEDHGQFDTAHHAMLSRLMAELGLITNRKTEEQKDGLDNGK